MPLSLLAAAIHGLIDDRPAALDWPVVGVALRRQRISSDASIVSARTFDVGAAHPLHRRLVEDERNQLFGSVDAVGQRLFDIGGL